jgi:hypothetical protein
MRKRRFSEQQLFYIRNHIPIDRLMQKTLHIPCKTSEGVFRFLCPLCNEFNTSIKPQTNLARCFRCEKNFNTIDMVMTVNNSTFVEAVDYLTDWQSLVQPHQLHHASRRQGHSHNKQSDSTCSDSSNSQPPTLDAPMALGRILPNVIKPLNPKSSCEQQPSPLYEDSSLIRRLERIELRLTILFDQLAEIRNLLSNQNLRST